MSAPAIAEEVRRLVDEENPWPGLPAFDEPSERFFNGREDETAELRRLIQHAPLTVLFGASGLGKTSLIQAGLFPLIRKDHVLPVYVRVDLHESTGSLDSQLKAAFEKELAAHDIDHPAIAPTESLWHYLHRRELELWSPQNQLVTPLFVLDQFEEVFTFGAGNRKTVEQLRVQLADFAENRIPGQDTTANTIDTDLALDSQRYRLLVSFREDFLPAFEAWKREIPSILRNRLRLLPMSGEQAFQAVYRTAPHLLDEAVAERVVRFVAAAQEQSSDSTREAGSALSDLSVDPALLSIFCRGLNERRKERRKQQFDEKLLDDAGNRIIEDFYEGAVADQPLRVQHFIENELITERGFRNSCDLGDAEAVHHVNHEELNVLVDRRLLRIEPHGRSDRVELTHDVLTRVVREHRAEHRERERSRKQRLRMLLLMLICAGLVSVAAWLLSLYGNAHRQARLALAGKLAMTALLKTESQFDLAALLSVQARNIADTVETRGGLLSVLEAKPPFLLAYLHHPASVTRVAFSLDGKTLATASKDSMIRLWDVHSRQALGPPLSGHEGVVWTVAFSPNGKILASASSDKTIRLWDVANRQPLGEPLRGHENTVTSIAFSPDNKILASGSLDKTIRIWDVVTRQLLGEPLKGHEAAVLYIAFSPDGKILASASDDKTVRLWDVATGQPLREPLRGHEAEVESVAFTPDGKILASGSDDKTIRLWDVATHQPLREPLTGHEGYVWALAFSPDGTVLASAGTDSAVRLWDVNTWQLIGEPLRGHRENIQGVAFSPDGKTLASASWDHTVGLWDLESRNALDEILRGHEYDVYGVAFSPNGKLVASAGRDKTVRLWDVATRQPVGAPLSAHENTVMSVAFSPDSKILASGSFDKTIRLWNVATRQVMGEPLRGHDGAVYSVVFSPDGKILASASDDTTIRLWDVATRQPLGEPLKGHSRPVRSVAFSPDGKTLASGSHDRTVRLWDVATRKLIGQPLIGHEDRVLSVAFGSGGKILASGSGDNKIWLWDVIKREPIGEPLRGHRDSVTSVAFSPDGKILASSSDDRTVRLWDVATRELLGQPLKGHEHGVGSIAFSPDGTILASGSDDTTVRLWDVSIGSWIRRLCGIANRNLLPEEWRQYIGPSIPYNSHTCPSINGR